MIMGRACRLELHGDGRSILLEQTDDPELARDILARHFDALKADGTIGRLVLIDEASGQVLARRQLKPATSRRRLAAV